MKTLILISALSVIAIASPVQNQRNVESFKPSIKKFPEIINRQKKSPSPEVSTLATDHKPEESNHDALQTGTEEANTEGRTVGLKNPIMIKKKFGYHEFRDSNEDLTQVDQGENCKQQVRIKLCEEENRLTPQNMKLSAAQEHTDRFMSEKDMENSIKLAKEAVENLQKDFVKIEHSPNANADLKPETDLHSNIEVARKALEHIHQSFGNLEPMSLKTMKASFDDNIQKKEDDVERLNKWRESIEAMKKRDGLFRNIDDAVNAESQHTKTFLAKDSMNLDELHHLEPKTNIQQDITSELLNNNHQMAPEDKLIMEKSDANTNENENEDSKKLQEHDTENNLRESMSDHEELKQKLEIETTATHKNLETADDKIESALIDHSDQNVMSDTQAKTSSTHEPHEHHKTNDDESVQTQNVKPENTKDQAPTINRKDFEMTPSEKKIFLEVNNNRQMKSTDFDADIKEKMRNKELSDGMNEQLINEWTQNKVLSDDEATLLKAAAGKINNEFLNRHLMEQNNDGKLMINNANTENKEHFDAAQKMRLSHEDKEPIHRMPMTNEERQSTHMVLNKPMTPVDHETQQTSSVLKTAELNFGHNSMSEQFDMMPNQDKTMEPMSMDPHTLEDPTFMRWAHERQSHQMPHLHHIPSAFHNDHLKTSMMDEHVHHMTEINSLDFPGHDENHLFASRLHDHMHNIPQLKSSDIDSAMSPSMYMAMRDSLGRSATDFNGMHWSHQGRSSYGSPIPTAGTHSGAIGVFPNANVGGCAIPLLLSCSPNLVSGSLAKPSTATYSAPAYRSGDDLTYYMKRDTKVNNDLPVIKLQRTTTPFNHKNEIVVDRKLK